MFRLKFCCDLYCLLLIVCTVCLMVFVLLVGGRLMIHFLAIFSRHAIINHLFMILVRLFVLYFSFFVLDTYLCKYVCIFVAIHTLQEIELVHC